MADAAAMAEVELSTALTAYVGFFPEDAPEPEPERFVRRWSERIGADERTAAFCAVDDDADGEIVATACGQPDPEQPDRGYVCSLYVRPALWGNGIGRRLHDAVLDHLHRVGFAEASLWVIEQHLRTRDMYERWGWQLAEGRGTLPWVEEVRYVTATSQLSNTQDHL